MFILNLLVIGGAVCLKDGCLPFGIIISQDLIICLVLRNHSTFVDAIAN